MPLENHHEPIIDRKLWEMACEERARRNRHGDPGSGHSNRYVFSGRIKCGECGSGFVGRKKYRKDGSSYRRIAQIEKKKAHVLDAFFAEDITRDEMRRMRELYDSQLTEVNHKLDAALSREEKGAI